MHNKIHFTFAKGHCSSLSKKRLKNDALRIHYAFCALELD